MIVWPRILLDASMSRSPGWAWRSRLRTLACPCGREDGRHRQAFHHRVAGPVLAKIVTAQVLDTGAGPGTKREVVAARPRRAEWRREHEGNFDPRPLVETTPGPGIEGNHSRPRLAVGAKSVSLAVAGSPRIGTKDSTLAERQRSSSSAPIHGSRKNTSGSPVPLPVVDRLRDRFAIGRVCVVAEPTYPSCERCKRSLARLPVLDDREETAHVHHRAALR